MSEENAQEATNQEEDQVETPAVANRVFRIVHDKKRTIKSTCSGQVIETLKRAKAPLSLNEVTQRVKGTTVGKNLTVDDIKARCLKVMEWHVKYSSYIEKTDAGYALTTVKA